MTGLKGIPLKSYKWLWGNYIIVYSVYEHAALIMYKNNNYACLSITIINAITRVVTSHIQNKSFSKALGRDIVCWSNHFDPQHIIIIPPPLQYFYIMCWTCPKRITS